MKIAIITDQHYGARNDSTHFLDFYQKFYDEIFFPKLEEEGIDTVLILGDTFDRRKYVNFYTYKRAREMFFDRLFGKDIKVFMLAGNHDTYYKNTNSVNALQELVAQGYPFHIYDKAPEIVEFDKLPILLIPWICDENRQESIHKIKSANAPIAAGHLEIQGFEMYRGSIVSHGDDRNLFDRYDMVISGHYHHRSSDGTIFYLGSHGEFTWSDYDDPRGFHVLDTQTLELTFIENPYKMFGKFWYDDATIGKEPEGYDLSHWKNQIVKVIVTNRNDPYRFDSFIKKFEKYASPLEIQIVEDHLNLALDDDKELIDEAQSTLSIFKQHIDKIDIKNIDKVKLEDTITELYREALSAE